MKTAQTYFEEANAVVPKLSSEEAIKVHAAGGGVFVDVRDSAVAAKTGTISRAVRIPRGFIEFAADPDMGFHNEAFQKDAEIYLFCGLGGQAALSGNTLIDMG
ncbi:rhodanese-like domain-containing protein [Cognatishimia activa]|uniref:rhodanese-like domain-containing protein n=1 Tax=Cognatishimia activa TaxID=1715691 RepID=UPI002E823E1F|nr:rhodanese-like domain-containing protein [Cognatishimia activa]